MTATAYAATTDALLGMVSGHLDLVAAPFTLPRSRILVLADPTARGALTSLRVSLAQYERSLEECTVVRSMAVVDVAGHAIPVTRVLPDRIQFANGATLTFSDPHTLSIGSAPAGSAVRLIGADGGATTLPIRQGLELAVGADAPAVTRAADRHDENLTGTAGVWADWFDRCPRVRDDLQEMTALCWWVLGANTISLPEGTAARAVVPSKIGYVGLWQWDAYFIAVGLRHGDPDLAREQLELAFAHAGADGQLPDVVHDAGVLATSDDLPPHDLAVLRKHGSAVADPDVPVPLTKPPLAAWALRRVLDSQGRGTDADAWARAAWETIARSQDWWFAAADSDGDGMPEYGHPYSSGLDDSPIFDGPLPLASPDLGAYLVVQDRELARHFTEQGESTRAARHAQRANATLARLLDLYDSEAGRFLARAGDRVLPAYTAVSLLPLLTGELPPVVAARLVAALTDPAEFGATWAVPTVATGDADFSAERMWRGPVWVNINALLVDGLTRSGYPAEARALAERTLELVIHGGGPHEYFNPFTGAKARTATTSFGWSAALFVDLAVLVSA